MAGMTEEPLLIDTDHAARLLCTTRQRLAQLRYEGRGPAYVKEGQRVLYTMDALRQWIQQMTVIPGEEE